MLGSLGENLQEVRNQFTGKEDSRICCREPKNSWQTKETIPQKHKNQSLEIRIQLEKQPSKFMESEESEEMILWKAEVNAPKRHWETQDSIWEIKNKFLNFLCLIVAPYWAPFLFLLRKQSLESQKSILRNGGYSTKEPRKQTSEPQQSVLNIQGFNYCPKLGNRTIPNFPLSDSCLILGTISISTEEKILWKSEVNSPKRRIQGWETEESISRNSAISPQYPRIQLKNQSPPETGKSILRNGGYKKEKPRNQSPETQQYVLSIRGFNWRACPPGNLEIN